MHQGKPLAGCGCWTLRLLADQMVELEIVDSISPETGRKTQKNGVTKHKMEYWGIPQLKLMASSSPIWMKL
ncbi:MAG: hypothetical protein V4719_12880 [Planctomycetota bacterium]